MSAPSSSTTTTKTLRMHEAPVDAPAVEAAAEQTGTSILIFPGNATTFSPCGRRRFPIYADWPRTAAEGVNTLFNVKSLAVQ